jgi:hypothetical protein
VSPHWNELVSAALVGTARAPVPGSRNGGSLLAAAAGPAVARRAGVPARTGLTRPDAAPEENLPAAPPAAAARLAGLLGRHSADARDELVAEWLCNAADRRRRIPAALLPAVLDLARARRALRPLVAAAGGRRAGWLAAQRPEWAYLLGEMDDDPRCNDAAWEEGTIGQRVGYLRALRRQDPEAARALLDAGWAGESVPDRAALLEVLRTGLSTADEPLLERALDDRRKDVRVHAMHLLANLPGSGYGRRMAERARACVRADRGRLRIELPAACDRGMRRDGIAPKPPAGVGARRWWLEEVLARTPLSTWVPEYAEQPESFLRLAPAEPDGNVLYQGLARAAAAQADPVWASLLADRWERRVAAQGRPDDRFLLEALYEVLPAAERAERAIRKAAEPGAGRHADTGLDRLLELCPAPWPPALAVAFRDHLAGLLRRAGTGWRIRERCRLAATRLPPDPSLLTGLAESTGADDGGGRAIEELIEVLRFRYDMIEELT